MNKLSKSIIIAATTLFICACSETYFPKQYAYFRINLPQNEYTECNTFQDCSFQISKHANLTPCDDTWATKSDQWNNIQYPSLNGAIHISYKKITPEELYNITEESRALAYKHTVRANSINESYYANDTSKVYGILYEMGGAAASQMQFFVTDSTHHFLRGSLYFNNIPNPDSIAPVSQYIGQDIIHLIETINWK